MIQNRIIFLALAVLILTAAACGSTQSPVNVTDTCQGADINDDGIIDDHDLHLIELAFASRPAGANWNPDADLDGSGRVDGADLYLFSKCYSE